MTGIIFCIELHQPAFYAQFLNCRSFNKYIHGYTYLLPEKLLLCLQLTLTKPLTFLHMLKAPVPNDNAGRFI